MPASAPPNCVMPLARLATIDALAHDYAEYLPAIPIDELRRLKRQRPFQPFRVHLKDGRVYEARYANLILVSDGGLTLGFPQLMPEGLGLFKILERALPLPAFVINVAEFVSRESLTPPLF